MKKLLLSLVVLMFVVSVAKVYAASEGRANKDMFATGQNQEFKVDEYGVPVSSPAGVIAVHETFNAIATASSDTYRLCTLTVATATFVSGGTTWTLASGNYVNKPHGRNITIKADFSTGIATAAVVGAGLVTGTDLRGNSQTETIVFSTVATLGVGVRAWQSVTSIACTGTVSSAATAIGFAVGTGNVIGLANNIIKSDNIRKVIENGALTTTYAANAAYDTIDFVTDGNGTIIYEVWYDAISK